MNKFYEVEGNIFETLEQAKEWKRHNQQLATIADITTDKDFNAFVDAYEEYREQGESIYDSIECAK